MAKVFLLVLTRLVLGVVMMGVPWMVVGVARVMSGREEGDDGCGLDGDGPGQGCGGRCQFCGRDGQVDNGPGQGSGHGQGEADQSILLYDRFVTGNGASGLPH